MANPACHPLIRHRFIISAWFNWAMSSGQIVYHPSRQNLFHPSWHQYKGEKWPIYGVSHNYRDDYNIDNATSCIWTLGLLWTSTMGEWLKGVCRFLQWPLCKDIVGKERYAWEFVISQEEKKDTQLLLSSLLLGDWIICKFTCTWTCLSSGSRRTEEDSSVSPIRSRNQSNPLKTGKQCEI